MNYGYLLSGMSYHVKELLLLLAMMILPIIAEIMVKSTFNKYSKVRSSRGLRAEEAAAMILRANGLFDVRIERVRGNLTDHYSPKEKVLRLSDSVYGQTSVAAIGVAAHECGHACQHDKNYLPIIIRQKIVPVVNICSYTWYIVFLLGCLFTMLPFLIYVGIAMFSAVVVFQLVTLPTELDASRRAMKTLERDCILETSELRPARKVLRAAAMTYVASLAASLMQLARLLLRVRR